MEEKWRKLKRKIAWIALRWIVKPTNKTPDTSRCEVCCKIADDRVTLHVDGAIKTEDGSAMYVICGFEENTVLYGFCNKHKKKVTKMALKALKEKRFNFMLQTNSTRYTADRSESIDYHTIQQLFRAMLYFKGIKKYELSDPIRKHIESFGIDVYLKKGNNHWYGGLDGSKPHA